jgi:endogenous inhibitor of DNA gyrase (YacG/DUF329 family)
MAVIVNLSVLPHAQRGTCAACGKKVGWYKIAGKGVRVCHHDDGSGKRCPTSGRPVKEHVDDGTDE